ncbi:RNA-directed DNA polymerase from mobile element jockey [Trichonephila clavipes]|nr:RNA-directed DNA polymerase from mobile element jockey [Trichonephila clavipes]
MVKTDSSDHSRTMGTFGEFLRRAVREKIGSHRRIDRYVCLPTNFNSVDKSSVRVYVTKLLLNGWTDFDETFCVGLSGFENGLDSQFDIRKMMASVVTRLKSMIIIGVAISVPEFCETNNQNRNASILQEGEEETPVHQGHHVLPPLLGGNMSEMCFLSALNQESTQRFQPFTHIGQIKQSLYFSPEGKLNQHHPRSIPHNYNCLRNLTHKRDKFRKALRALYPLIGWNSQLNMYNKILLYTAVLRPILTYGSPVWGYAADANIKILEVAQNSIIRSIVKADRYTKNSIIYKDIKVLPLKNYIQKLAISFFSNLPNIDNINVQSLNNYIPVPDIKRPSLCTSRAGWLAAADCFRMFKYLALKTT